MSTFVFMCHATTMPAEAAPPTAEQMEAAMGAWNARAGKVGDGMVDFGTPLASGVRVATDGRPRRHPVAQPPWRAPKQRSRS